MQYSLEDLFNEIESKELKDAARWAYEQSKCRSTYDEFINYAVPEKNSLLKQASRFDCIAELKQNVIMYRWLYNNLADEHSKGVLAALAAQRLFGDAVHFEYVTESGNGGIIAGLNVHSVKDCGGLELYAIEHMREQLQKQPPVLSVNVSSLLDNIWQIPYRILLLQPLYGVYLRYDGKCVVLYAFPGKSANIIADMAECIAPKITVFTCAYNTPEHQIRRAIESILYQTCRDFEYIIVDNGCTDKTSDIIEQYANSAPNVRRFRLEQNSINDAWNLMLREARGEFLVILDSDDYYEPHFLQIMADEQRRTGADLVACGSRGEAADNPLSRGLRSFPTSTISLQGLKDIWPDVFGLLSSIWAKLFRLTLFRTVELDKNAGTGNDTLGSLYYLKQCQRVTFVGDILHVYLQVERSSSRRFDASALQRNTIIFNKANDFLESIGALSERNYAYNCHILLSGIKRSVRLTVDAADIPVFQRIMFLEDIISDGDAGKASVFMKQNGPFYTEIIDAERHIAEQGQDAMALLLAGARADILQRQNCGALEKLLVLAGGKSEYSGRATLLINAILKSHQLIPSYAPWMSAYPDASVAVYESRYGEAAEILIERINNKQEVPYADDVFELLLSLCALNEDSAAFVYVKKLRLHYEVMQGNIEKAIPLAEELNDMCPSDRMVLYYTLNFLVSLSQQDDAKSLAESAQQYCPDDPLLRFPENTGNVIPYPDEITR